jgi:hypothetical protein
MNKFQESVAAQDHIVFCILDNTHTYSNAWHRELIKNITDFCLQNITIQGYTVLEGVDEDELLRTAAKTSARHAVVLAAGTEFITHYVFFDLLNDLIKKQDFFILGHVLDRKDCYYELHQQCYVINLDHYKQLGQPEIGQQAMFSSHAEYCPDRSQENYHNDHTPKWVKSGTGVAVYQHKAHGWNILSRAFKHNLTVLVFDEAFRSAKKHYYPEWESSFLQEINYAYARSNFCAGLAVYPINSEQMKFDVPGPLRQLIVPASGLGWIEHLVNIGYDHQTVVKFFDYSPPTLEYLRAVIDWDGEDYPAFFREFMDHKYGYLKNGSSIIYCGPQDIESEWTKFSSQFDWPTLWADISSKVRFEFHLVNLLDATDSLDWIDCVDGISMINVSNIFNYIGTATFYSMKQRVHAERALFDRLKAKLPNIYVQVSRFAADGFVAQDHTIRPASEFTLVNLSELNTPTWHTQGDWTS